MLVCYYFYVFYKSNIDLIYYKEANLLNQNPLLIYLVNTWSEI